jgi:peroxidase
VLQLVSRFNAVGLSEQDVVIAGAHTIGKARCTSFQEQLHDQNGKGQPDPSLETSCLHKLQHLCPAQNGDSNQTTNPGLCTPTSFDNQYYKNLQAENELLFSDEVLFTTPGDSLSLINLYANRQEAFFNYFAKSMLKMGRTKVLTGNQGQVHTN